MLTRRRNWLPFGMLIILGAGTIGACTYLVKRPAPVMEGTPVVEKPQEHILEEECYKEPGEALDIFLFYLHNGQYDKAAKLYGGDDYPSQRAYLSLSEMELEERITFLTRFFEDFCKGYGTCLEHRIVSEEIISEDEVLFYVQFYKQNGEVFELVMPPWVEKKERYATEFSFRVRKVEDCYKSIDFPPITP